MTEVTTHSVSWISDNGYTATCVPGDSNPVVSFLSWTDSKDGSRNPFWKRQVARGLNASTPYYRSWKTFNMPNARVDASRWNTACFPKQRRYHWSYGNLANLQIPAGPSGLSLLTADNRARMNAFKSIKQQQQAFQSLVCAGEMGETVRMLVAAGRGLRRLVLRDHGKAKKLISSLRKRRRETIESLLKRKSAMAAEMHLQAVFGWRPFMSDIGSANAWLERRLELVDPTLPFKGSGDYETDVPAVFLSGSGVTTYQYVMHTKTATAVRYYGRIEGATLGTRRLMEARLLGVNLGEWLPALYEITPWSFFIDYFSNLGDVIEAWSAWDCGIRWCSKTTFQSNVNHVTDWQYRNVFAGSPAYALGSVSSGGKHISTNNVVVRTKDVTLQPPRLQFEIPGSGIKWLNIAALGRVLAQRWK